MGWRRACQATSGGRGIGPVPQGRAAVGPSRRLRCGAGHTADVADDLLTRRSAWTLLGDRAGSGLPAHPPCRLRRAHHQHADRGHARDADLGRNRPPGTALSVQKNASSRAWAGGEGRFRVRHCSADNSRITLSTYRLARGRRVHSSAVSSRQAARYSLEIRCRSATKLGSVPISEIS